MNQQNQKYLDFDEGKLYQIICFSKKPLCIEKHSMASGIKLVVGEKKQKTNNTLFSFENVEHHYYRIRVFHSNQYLDVYDCSTENGGGIFQKQKNTNTNQMFRFELIRNGFYVIRARHSSKVLDISDIKMETGAILHQYEQHSGDNQIFQVVEID